MRNIDRGAIVAICILLLAVGGLLWAVVGIVQNIELPDADLRGDAQDITDTGREIFDDRGNQTITPNVNVEDGVRTIEVEGFFWQGLARGTEIYSHDVRNVFLLPYFHIDIRRINVDTAVSELVATLEWLPVEDAWPNVVGLDVTDEGGFRLLIWDDAWNDAAEGRLVYAEFDAAGNLTFTNELPEIQEAIGNPFEVTQVIFADTGDILLSAWETGAATIHILAPDGSPRAEIPLEVGYWPMASMSDGRVVLSADWGAAIREIDLAAGTLGEIWDDWLPEDVWIIELYSAQAGSPFDLYAQLSAWPGMYFYGFDRSDMSWTRLIDAEGRWSLFTAFLADGRLVILEMGSIAQNVTYLHIIPPNH